MSRSQNKHPAFNWKRRKKYLSDSRKCGFGGAGFVTLRFHVSITGWAAICLPLLRVKTARSDRANPSPPALSAPVFRNLPQRQQWLTWPAHVTARLPPHLRTHTPKDVPLTNPPSAGPWKVKHSICICSVMCDKNRAFLFDKGFPETLELNFHRELYSPILLLLLLLSPQSVNYLALV